MELACVLIVLLAVEWVKRCLCKKRARNDSSKFQNSDLKPKQEIPSY